MSLITHVSSRVKREVETSVGLLHKIFNDRLVSEVLGVDKVG